MKRARHIDSYWSAQLEMGDLSLLADRCKCLVLSVKLSVFLKKSVSRTVRSEETAVVVCVLKSFQFLLIVTSLSPPRTLGLFLRYIQTVG